ncbi:hypothetical protein QJS10_CPB19g00991 [Acorus calamus]|uniref:Uncharacterized protein n=1 Tax=Acorus calamus TaxID=4465 RepID=A0AAV9CIA2_ACOCL|nr:hypothetical protein QJS10_CPB19g00991 [Acorus calamus]
MLFILIISPLTSTAQTQTKISLGSSISTNPSWISPSGDFAFDSFPSPTTPHSSSLPYTSTTSPKIR